MVVQIEVLSHCFTKMKVCLCTLTLPAHAHVYILERSQHKVPEEALKVSNTDSVCRRVPVDLLIMINGSALLLFLLLINLFPVIMKYPK